MPELPEVETIKNQLNQCLPFKIIKKQSSQHWNTFIKNNKKDEFVGKYLESVERYGKYLIFNLGDDSFFVSHLGMSGNWRINAQTDVPHTHLVLSGSGLKNPISLSYVDPRRFGRAYFFNGRELTEFLDRMGKDVSQKGFTPSFVFESMKRYPNRFLKAHLLDQKVFAGIGNYMASEICALAGLHPEKKCSEIGMVESKSICKATQKILKQTFKSKGTTFHGGYKDAYGNKGEGVLNLVVFYQKICQMCNKTPVVKMMLKGRGTYYCPKCQVL